MYNQKYDINEEVTFKATAKKGLIVGTKSLPWKKKLDPYNRTEISPNNDYLVLILKETVDEVNHYSGLVDVLESEIEVNTANK